MTPFDNQFSKNTIDIVAEYPESNIYLYPYARYAFLELLTQLNIKSVYLPSFICRDMLAPINKLNIEYIFYEVNIKLTPILQNIKCDAILSVNYFGFEQNITPFIEYKKKYDAVFIEDNAHGFLSRDINGNLLGTRGDFGLLSIRKTISLPNAAALLVNNEKYKQIEFKIQNFEFSFEDEKYNKKQVLKKIFFNKYIGISFVILRRLLRYVKTGSSIPLPDKESEIELPSNKFTTPMLKDLVLNIDINLEIRRRLTMYKKVQELAKVFNIRPIYDLYNGIVPFEFAFIKNKEYKEFEKLLYLNGFFVLPWPDLPDEVVENCPEFYKDVKVVPFLW